MATTFWDDHNKFKELYSPKSGEKGTYKKIDFHFHTLASGSDYKEKNCSYEDIAKKIMDENYDAIFVTDHNEWKGIKELKDACKKIGCKTKILPGVELTLTARAICLLDEGKKVDNVKYHCLALLPDDNHYEDRIKSLITKDHTENEILTKAPVDRIISTPLEDVSDKIKSWNGIFIPAHLHQGKSLESRSIDDLYADSLTIEMLEKYFDAVEIRKPENDIFDGEFTTNKDLKVPMMTCVLGTDSHELSKIGSKATYLLTEKNSFEEIKDSLKHRSRVKYNLEKDKRSRIICININGSFIKNLSITFSDYMNSLIGAKGSGKTSIVELIRFGLGYDTPENLQKYLSHLLGPTGKVSIEIQDSEGQRFLFQRKHDDTKPIVISSDEVVVEREAIIPHKFNVEIRGWGETTNLAVSEDEQLKLIDNLDKTGVISKAKSEFNILQSGLRKKFFEVVDLAKQYKDVKVKVDELTLKESSLLKLKLANLTEWQQQKEEIDKEKVILNSIIKNVEILKSNLAVTLFSSEIEAQFSTLEKYNVDNKSNSKEKIELILLTKQSIKEYESEISKNVVEKVEALIGSLKENSKLIEEGNSEFDNKYQIEFNKLPVDEQDILIKRNEITKEIANIAAERARLENIWSNLHQKIQSYSTDLISMQEKIDLISSKRVDISKEINEQLIKANVDTKITLEPKCVNKGNLPANKKVESAFKEIAKDFEDLNKSTITNRLPIFELDKDKREEFNLIIQDRPIIEFKLYDKDWKPTSQLSAGQKSTAVLPLLLIASHGPIIMDQPEDNLDNKYIGSSVVNMLTNKKQSNQIVITSHNASIVVMTDSEYIIEMEDENNNGQIKECGFLTGPSSIIKDSVLTILDGGKDALISRFKKYGITQF